MQGRIIRGIAGFYYVHVPGTGTLECKAKGIFRKNKLKPLVGDLVQVTLLDSENKKGNIKNVLERYNELIRPAVANIDQAMVIFSIKKPEPNFNLLDRFLLMMEQKAIPCILVFNKCDLASEEEKQAVETIYQGSGYPVLFVSCRNMQKEACRSDSSSDWEEELSTDSVTGHEKYGLDEIHKLLAGKTTTVAGPSGVGKSSLINLLQSNISMETGSISEKIERGRHTTRHSEFIPIAEDTFILDTPGFSSLMVFDMEKEELEQYYPEFEAYRRQCRFHGCSHTHEPDCGVKEAVAAGDVSKERYENYLQIYEELKSRKKW